MELLLLSILALAVGPALVQLLGGRRWVSGSLDAFVLVVIAGLVILHILPEGVEGGGWVAILAAGVGLAIPTLGERVLRTDVKKAHNVVIVMGLLALALHVFLDGMILAGGEAGSPVQSPDGNAADEQGRTALILGVILHRLPVGIGIWWIVRGAFGLRTTLWLFLGIIAATSTGFLAAGPLYKATHGPVAAVLQCLLAGSLLHVVLHTHGGAVGVPRRFDNLVSGLGALAGLAILIILPGSQHYGGFESGGALDTFLTLLLTSAPALVLAYLAVGMTHVLMPARWLGFLKKGSSLSQALRGLAVGLPIPVCSCGVVPLYKELILRGVPVPAAVAFLVATPELELAAVLLSFQLLGAEVALARLAAAAALAVLVGVIVGRLVRSRTEEPSPTDVDDEASSLPQVIGKGLRFGFVEAVDSTAPWILVGLATGALLRPFLEPGWFAGLPPGMEVPLMACLGLPLYVCASGSTPLAAILLASGMSPGAALAFLLTGPATNVTTMGVLARLHGRRVAVAFAISMLTLATCFGYAVNGVISPTVVPDLASVHDHGTSWWRIGATAVLAAAFLASFFRQGTRPFVNRILSGPMADPDHEHRDSDEAQRVPASSCH